MRRVTLLVIPILVAAASLSAWLIAEKGHTPLWREELNQYLTYKKMAVRLVVQASLPWNFGPEMSGATDFSYKGGGTYWYPILPSLLTTTLLTTTHSGSAPLLYPVDELWCALLEPAQYAEDADQVKREIVVYVALHRDLYNADWIVHESAGDLPQLGEVLSRIGCGQLAKPGR
jgi:hypothetical protein